MRAFWVFAISGYTELEIEHEQLQWRSSQWSSRCSDQWLYPSMFTADMSPVSSDNDKPVENGKDKESINTPLKGLETISPLVQSVQETPEPISTMVQGSIPPWINGKFLRNGPGKFEFGTLTTTTGSTGWQCYTSSRSTKARWRTWAGSWAAMPTRRTVRGTASWCQNSGHSPCPTPVKTSFNASCLALRWLSPRIMRVWALWSTKVTTMSAQRQTSYTKWTQRI